MTRDQILGKLESLEPWKARVMCASAAERTAPIFRRLGRPQSMPIFEAALAAAWEAVEARAGSQDKRAVSRLPEAKQDDSHDPEYYAGRMLEILVRALDYASTGRTDAATQCIECAAGICDDLDVILTASPGETFRYDPKNPPPPGEIQAQELRAHADVLEQLREASAAPAVIEVFRRLARERAEVYESLVPQLRERMSTRRRR